jgi:hypothetical protein
MSDLDQLASASRTANYRSQVPNRAIRIRLSFADAFWAGVAIALGFLVVCVILGTIYGVLNLIGVDRQSSLPRPGAIQNQQSPQQP